RDRLTEELVASAGVVIEHRRAAHDLALGASQRLAGVEALDARDLVSTLADAVSNLLDNTAALVGAHLRPRALVKRLARGIHGAVNILFAGLGDRRDTPTGGRVSRIKSLTSCGVHQLAANQQLDLANF